MNILQIKKVLTRRTTSVGNDEPLCRGNLLGVDPEKVVGMSFEDDPTRTRNERMKIICSLIPQHYLTLIFWDTAKLFDKGFHWASALLISSNSCGRTRTYLEAASWSPGLRLTVTLPSMSITRSPIRELKTFRVVVDDTSRPMIQ